MGATTAESRRLIIRPDATAENYHHHATLVRHYARQGGAVYEFQGPAPLPKSAIHAIHQQGATHHVLSGDPLSHTPDPADLIILDDVLSRLRAADQPWFVRRLVQSLNPGGALAIADHVQTTGPHAHVLQALHLSLHHDIGQDARDILNTLTSRIGISPLPPDIGAAWGLDAHVTLWGRLIDRASWVVTR